jgi:hypothetical protein
MDRARVQWRLYEVSLSMMRFGNNVWLSAFALDFER